MSDPTPAPETREATGPPPGYTRVGAVAEIPSGTMKPARVGEIAMVVCNVDGEFYALEDNCSHQHFPLSAGELEFGELTCDWHGARFDVRTGEPLTLPAVDPVRTFQVWVGDGEIWVRTEGEPPTPPEALVLRDSLRGVR